MSVSLCGVFMVSQLCLARLAGKYRWWEFPAVITVLGNSFAKVGNTGKYEVLELFLLKYSFIFL